MHQLAPAGLQVVMRDHQALLRGEVASQAIVTQATALALAIDGVEEVVDETTRPEAQTEDDELRARLEFLIDSDTSLSKQNLSVQVRQGKATIFGEVRSAAARLWAVRLLQAAVPGASVEVAVPARSERTPEDKLPRIDGDSLAALVLSRLSLVHETEAVNARVKTLRQRVQLSADVASEKQRELVEEIVTRTYGLREAKFQLSLG